MRRPWSWACGGLLSLAFGALFGACGGESESSSSGGQGGSPSGGAGGTTGSGATGGTVEAGVCSLPADSGPCDGAFPRWFFNSSTGKCEQFSYGGCDGNANNFETADACLKTCAPTVTNACDAITCETGTQCLFVGMLAFCLSPCPDGGSCPFATTCGCAASCAGCKNCISACVPAG